MSARAAMSADEAKPLDAAQLAALVRAAKAERDRQLAAAIMRVARMLARLERVRDRWSRSPGGVAKTR